MKSQLAGVLALLVAAAGLNAGCVAQAQVSGSAEAEAPVVFVGDPTLVAIDSGVWVVRDADYATYYVDDYYWVYRDGRWYRSPDYSGGWVVIEVSVVPGSIATRNPAMYVHFHGEATARTRTAPGRGERPGVGNERKAEGEQPGNAHEETPGAGNRHREDGDRHADADQGDRDRRGDKDNDHKRGDNDDKKENKENKKDAKKKK
jgi:hypothetical protein